MTVETYNNIYGTYPGFSDMGVRVNGADLQVIEPGGAGTKYTFVTLGAGEKQVELICGLQSKPGIEILGSWVCDVQFTASATQITPSAIPRLLVYGDSIAVGANATSPSLQGWVQLVRNEYTNSVLYEAWGWRSLHDDASTESAREAFAAHIAAQSPAEIWLAIGTNDYGLNKWSAAAFGAAYADLLDKLHAALPDAVIYAQTPLVRSSEAANGSGSTLGDYRTQIATAQSTRSAYCTLVDGTDILTTGDLTDGVHPSTAGHALYAAYVKTVLGIV